MNVALSQNTQNPATESEVKVSSEWRGNCAKAKAERNFVGAQRAQSALAEYYERSEACL